jgi:16S rRNA (guanine527-N7)-methyltransferase
MSADAALEAALGGLELPLDASARRKLLSHIDLVDKWNRVYNLTAVRRREDMLTHHVLDSLAVTRHLSGGTLVDVGSGAGFPGIPLAIARPLLRVTLLDSNHKKTTFLRQAVIELGLENVDVVCERVEAWHPAAAFDIVISRAFSELREFVTLAGHLCSRTGAMVAMKGVYPYEEVAQLPAGHELVEVRSVHVPGLGADRHLVLLRRASRLQEGV